MTATSGQTRQPVGFRSDQTLHRRCTIVFRTNCTSLHHCCKSWNTAAMDADVVNGSGTPSAAKDATTVASYNSSDIFENDGMPKDVSSQMFKSSGSLGSVLLEEKSSASIRSTLRAKPKSSELKLVSKSSATQSHNSMLSDLTINKFNIKSMGLIGREREIEILRSCYERMNEKTKERENAPQDQSISSSQFLIQSNAPKELVFISGYSGVGKSSLARTLEKETNEKTEGIYVEGKFDLNTSNEPYSGIASALGHMCKRLLKTEVQSRENANLGDASSTLGSRFSGALGPTARLLSHYIPELNDELRSMRRNSNGSSEEEQSDFDMVQKQVKYAFRVLMKALNAEFSPIVLVLDDLQWADVSSLELMDYLISDMQNPNALMILGCYRSNEVDEESPLFKKIQNLEMKQDKFNFHITDVAVGSCDTGSVNKMIMAMMSIDDEECTRGLAEVCFKRTGGNPFFLIEFMVMLQDKDLISYNIGLLKWIWDENKIAEATMSTDNVVDLLQARMRKMPVNVQLLLQYAACLGSSFSTSILDLIWREQSVMGTEYTAETISRLLAVVVASNLVEPCGEDEYRWVHDKVQEAAMSLSDTVTVEFQFRIGSALYHSLDANRLEEKLFDVVDLINKGRVCKRYEFAKLNLRAAKKAKKISAFPSAANYAANGIEFLPSDKWTTHRALALALYTLGCEVELALGHVEAAEIYSNEVLSRPECTTMEALPLKMAKSLKLCTVDMKYKETIEINVVLLKDLGISLRWTRATAPLQCITAIKRTIKMAKTAPSPKDIFENLGPMRDPKHRAATHLLARIIYAGYRNPTEEIYLCILCVCKMVEMTLKYGVGDTSSTGFAMLGAVAVMVQQDYKTAAYFAEMAMAMQRSSRAYGESETFLNANLYCFPWSRPFQQCIATAAEGYASGMRSGDTVNAMWNLICHHVWLPYTMGKRLGPILELCPKLLSQMEELSQPEQVLGLRMFWQMMFNLATTSESTVLHKLEGDIFSAEAFTANTNQEAARYVLQGELLVFYDVEAAAKRAIKDGDKFAKLSPGIFHNMFETFHRAIALFAMARRTGKRKYRIHANKLAKRIKGWVQSGNPNVGHYHLSMIAEQAALTKKCELAEENYKKAIALAARTGHMHHAALINERYAEFLHEELSDEKESKYRLGEAIRFYEEWGAFGKVEALKKQL
eukprot:scaffold15205_cov128-Cylindrotheca_fusiformis.AAC.1